MENDDCDNQDHQRHHQHHQDMTLMCVEQDDEIIINPDTNHNHQPLLSVDDTDCTIKRLQIADSRCSQPAAEDTKDSSTVKKKNDFSPICNVLVVSIIFRQVFYLFIIITTVIFIN